MPTAVPEVSNATELQKSIFNAPPGSVPSKPTDATAAKDGHEQPHGVKRAREDEEENDDGEAPMEEGEDSDAPMEDSSDED